MRACSGTWIAHGSGSADKETAGRDGRIKVPPSDPAYTLRRIWLTKEEEQGYYYGFANEGLWPLCHIAHVRPVFRTDDWLRYQQVNQRFADAVVAEADTDNPVVLVQDYHFALLPALVRERLPRATIITFWHIPWPNPESFGICPWREEILQGTAGESTILGFHTRYHCNNFLQTVDRFLEARIEHESSTISCRGPPDAGRELPDLDRLAAAAAGAGRHRRSAGSRCAAARPRPTTTASRSASTGSTTPRASSSGCARSSGCSNCTRSGSAASPSSRSPRRPARRSTSTSASRAEVRTLAREHQRHAIGDAGYQPIQLLIEHHDADAGARVLPRLRRLHGHQPARRHEPRGQGIRRRARRRAGRADPDAVRRRRRANCTRR